MPQPILKPNFLKVSTEPSQGTQRVVPYGAGIRVFFNGPNRENIIVLPQLFGKFLALGVSQELSPQVARSVLEFLRADIPRLYKLKDFLLREVPAGSSEKAVSIEILKFTPDRVELLSRASGSEYTIRIHEGGKPECSCPDFFYRRRRTGTWCKHIIALHQMLREAFSPDLERFPYHLPLWEMDNIPAGAKLVEDLGGTYELMSYPMAVRGDYSRRREEYDTPVLGVEFEIPENLGAEEAILRKAISALRERGLILSYERDGSVSGGEIKLTPFPATLEEVLEKGNLLKSLRDLGKGLFESSKHAGLHVHINMWPFRERMEEMLERLLPFTLLLQGRFNLASIFGRGMNPYATRVGALVPLRYWWVNFMSLPHTVEVRLGCSKHGDPVRILLMALFMQRVFWAILEGRFKLPSFDESGDKLISAFSKLLSEEERRYIVPLLREALVSPTGD